MSILTKIIHHHQQGRLQKTHTKKIMEMLLIKDTIKVLDLIDLIKKISTKTKIIKHINQTYPQSIILTIFKVTFIIRIRCLINQIPNLK